MNLSIPDKIYKFFVLLGAIIVAYMYFQKQTDEKIYFDKIDLQNNMYDSLKVEFAKMKYETKEIYDLSKDLSIKYGVKNPLKFDKDSSLIFTKTLAGEKNDLFVSDSIEKIWNKSALSDENTFLLIEKLKITSKRLDDEEKLKNLRFENFSFYESIGYFFLGTGILFWLLSELPNIKNEEIEQYSKKLEDRHYIHCQSCGKKFTSMRKYGIEKDGTKNYAYCNQCYEDGEFRDNGLTLESLIEEAKIKNKKLPKFLQNIIIRNIKKLERWDM